MCLFKGLMIVCVIMVLASGSGCKRENIGPADTSLQMEYMGLLENGCTGHDTQSALSDRGPCLAGHTIDGNFLTLTIYYEANCCPAFVDSIRILDQTVEILIDDTLRGCRCICPCENDFNFIYSGSGALRILFGWFDEPFSLDTTIMIQ